MRALNGDGVQTNSRAVSHIAASLFILIRPCVGTARGGADVEALAKAIQQRKLNLTKLLQKHHPTTYCIGQSNTSKHTFLVDDFVT